MLDLHIFTLFISLKDVRCLFSMSIQIPIHSYEPDPVADKMKFDYAMARVRDFWAWMDGLLCFNKSNLNVILSFSRAMQSRSSLCSDCTLCADTRATKVAVFSDSSLSESSAFPFHCRKKSRTTLTSQTAL